MFGNGASWPSADLRVTIEPAGKSIFWRVNVRASRFSEPRLVKAVLFKLNVLPAVMRSEEVLPAPLMEPALTVRLLPAEIPMSFGPRTAPRSALFR